MDNLWGVTYLFTGIMLAMIAVFATVILIGSTILAFHFYAIVGWIAVLIGVFYYSSKKAGMWPYV